MAMRILYTVGLLVGVPVAFFSLCLAGIALEDFLQSRFGKPPLIVKIIGGAAFVFIIVKTAWDKAGQWAS